MHPPSLEAVAYVAMLFVAWRLGIRGRTRIRGQREPGAEVVVQLPDGIAGISQLQAAIDQVRSQLAELELRRVGADHELVQQVRSLERTTGALAVALRAPKARGRWGELHLRRVVEAAGMLDHCDFHEQVLQTGEDGARRQPDLVVRLAGGRSIAVDAKVPMDSYLAAVDVETDAERERLELEHVRRVRAHVRELASRRYAAGLERGCALVVLFLPSEDLLRVTLERDPSLLEHAAAHDVALATPSTLISILRGVAQGWREAALAENARRISELGASIHDRIVIVNEHLAKLGRSLELTVRSFDDAVGSMHTRLVPAARELRELGVAGTRELEPVARPERVPRVPSPL